MQWYNELSSGEESSVTDEDGDELEVDMILNSDHDTNTAEEIAEHEESEENSEDSDQSTSTKFYLRKDKTTKWKQRRPNVQIKFASITTVTETQDKQIKRRLEHYLECCCKLERLEVQGKMHVRCGITLRGAV
ncbi:unnamed protein product [Acanthoscelides obtectus]|uniref:Uncharacterized protein n=1 Tax=Acanthoscelides obtectus TaxID=200917 RepID=A0A9P0ME75_ACAOB|nr:unnamed protein product [Acanthoscelides obtectus]CAK1674071.1 hypothetical protein AOBTE_LOCUS29525 [Acanthoscelides obtectus]